MECAPGIAASVKANPDRYYFVNREDAQKVLDHCPDAQWKLIFALARYGGLRCPSEVLALTWAHVNWEHDRIRVPSLKTAHIEGMDARVIPLFPELRPYLMEVFDEAEPGTEHVITRYRQRNVNCGRSFTGSSARQDLTRGRSCSRTCDRREKQNWSKRTRCTLCVSGSATVSPWRRNTICN